MVPRNFPKDMNILGYNLQILDSGEQLGLKHFRPIKPLGSGDTGRFVGSSRYISIFVALQ